MLTWKKNYEELVAKLEASTKELDEAKVLIEKNTELEARIKELSETPGSPDKVVELQSDITNLQAKLSEKDVDLETLRQSLDKLTAEKEVLEKKEYDFSEAVAAKALEITQAQGIPPLSAKPTSQPSSDNFDGDLVRQLENIKEPSKRREFWVKNQKELTRLLTGK
jgi:DNA repair exonuclease SbcCD ATPase subunit